MAYEVVVEHLNHLGIVAEVCREIGVAEWLNAQDPSSRQQVSVGTATVAMVLNGLGFSNRQLYLVPQFFDDKPVAQRHGTGDEGRRPQRRLPGADLRLAVCPRCDDAICRPGAAGTSGLWGAADGADPAARRHDVLLGKRGVSARGRRPRRGDDGGDLWVFPRSPRRPGSSGCWRWSPRARASRSSSSRWTATPVTRRPCPRWSWSSRTNCGRAASQRGSTWPTVDATAKQTCAR
jgi:hypothetical protein